MPQSTELPSPPTAGAPWRWCAPAIFLSSALAIIVGATFLSGREAVLFDTTVVALMGVGMFLAARHVRRLEERRRDAEFELQASESRFHQLADSMPQAIWTARPDGVAEYLNEPWYKLSGLPRTVGDGAWRGVVHPDDLPKIDAAWNDAVRTGEFAAVEFRMQDATRGGAYRWFLEQAVAVRDAEGRISRWYATSTDIDAQKRTEAALRDLNATLERRVDERTEKLRQSEEGLRLLIEGVRDYAIFMLDSAGYVTTWNSGAELIQGYRAEEIIGKHVSRFYLPDDAAEGRPDDVLRAALRHGRFEEEGRRIRADGSVFFASINITPAYDKAGKHVGFVKVIRDVTARVQADEVRHQALLRTRFVEQIIAAREDEQRRFARDLHDGIGQSLTSLRMALRVVEEAEDLETARTAARELRPMIVRTQEEVRRLTKNLRPRVLDDLGLVPALTRFAEDYAAGHGTHVRLDTAGAVGVRLPSAVETALFRIAQEALTNVAKHSGATTVEVRLDCVAAEVQLSVADDGIGYDPTAAGTDDRPHFGIVGMRERVALLEGTFDISRRPGGGTTVMVNMPLREEAVV